MSIVKTFFEVADKRGDEIAQIYKSNKSYFRVTYKDLKNDVLKFASFLQEMHLGYQDKVFICSENRIEWTVIDFAILSLGAVDVPKGADVTLFEAEVIINSVLSNIVIVENLNLLNLISQVRFKVKPIIIIIDDLSDKDREKFSDFKIYSYKECILIGDKSRRDEAIIKALDSINLHDMATIIYTSGTTGNLKGNAFAF